MSGSVGFTSSSRPSPKRDICPATLLRRLFAAPSSALSYTAMSWVRFAPVQSIAPERISDSTTRLLTCSESMRWQKSKISLYGPPLRRWAMMESIALSPQDLIAPRPKRMPLTPCAFWPTENLRTLWLISGGRSGMPCLRQYCEYAATLPLSDETELSRAAKNCTG